MIFYFKYVNVKKKMKYTLISVFTRRVLYGIIKITKLFGG